MALVSMPFGALFSPSLGLSLLKAALTRERIDARTHYFTIAFAEIVGSRFYGGIAGGKRPPLRHLAGEWIFSRALFGDEGDTDAWIESMVGRKRLKTSDPRRRISPALINQLLRARERVDPFLDACTEELLSGKPRMVGLTSVFQQHVASLALARRIKAVSPETFIVFGGANCEGVMGAETIRQFPFVDAAVSGEGDLIFPSLVRHVLEGEAVDGLTGVRTRASIVGGLAENRFENAPSVRAMDELPYPDCDDYIERFRRSRFDRDWHARIFFETSRGCWWGEKMHCTFCGLNGATMKFRSKSPQRALDEIVFLAERYEGSAFEATDNILDLSYFDTLLPALAARGIDLGLFWETKANLRKEQVRMLRDSGVTTIQPGIESLSDTVLRMMRKGVTALHNIQLLKWCKQFGVEPSWNILWGFPGEPPEEYTAMARIVPLLAHLQPPGFFSTIRLDRFSPNFFDAERLGFSSVEPLEAYEHVYPLPKEAVRNLAYHFRFRYSRPQTVESYAAPLARALRAWRRTSAASDLFLVDTGGHLLVADLRPMRKTPLHVLSPEEREIYLACDAVTDLRTIATATSRSSAEVERILTPLIANGIVLRDGARHLALAVALGDYSPPPSIVAQFFDSIREIAEPADRGIAIPLEHRLHPRTRRTRFPRMDQRILTSSRFTVDQSHVLIH
ncbi:MAG TPA: RiPP maturation radical SAM C-methyltransferase [Thermoanaerobaculia bacterium]|nr:RiPP maturation radical SAM C-methyltransferase [Thermoanaerobaculia bacterium]